ncbi:hypothetical protein GCM10018952_67650 [Streptosporangium vulgare]
MSWEPTAMTRVSGESPSSPATSGASGPITSPGRRIGGRTPAAGPSPLVSAVSHSRVLASSSWVVEALVSSAPTCPVSQYAIRSGMSSSVAAEASRGSAASWWMVLNGWRAMPVRAYSSSKGTWLAVRSVRASR